MVSNKYRTPPARRIKTLFCLPLVRAQQNPPIIGDAENLFCSGLCQGRHNAFGKQPDILERHRLGHAAEMESKGESRETGFLLPTANGVNAPMGIADDDKSPLHI